MASPVDKETPQDPSLAAVASRTAGNRIIRGGSLRGAGYVLSTAATAAAFALLLRHLGVADFGRFSTVIALVTVATGLAEAGLQTTAQGLYTATDPPGRRRLLGNLVGIRVVLTPLAVLLAAAFAVVAGYGSTLVVGVLVAGLGGVLVAIAGTMTLPLSMELRYGRLTFIEVSRQLVIVAGIVLMVAAGAALAGFFAVYLISGVAMLVLACLLVDRSDIAAPRLRLTEWMPIVRAAGPLAISVAVNTFYLKLLIIMSSLLISEEEVGLFAAASRVTEVLVGLPIYMVGVAFPLLAHAGAHDEGRLTYAMQRIGEVTLVVAGLFTVVLFVAAEPIILVFGGSDFDAAVPVLQIQAFALLGASMAQAWILGVIAVGAQRSLLVVNTIALGSLAVLGAALIPTLEADGASLAAVIGETILAASMLVALVRARPGARPDARYVPRVLVAIGLGLACALIPVAPVVQGLLAATVYVLASLALRTVPIEVAHALLRRDPKPEPGPTS
jgi:O-antigen/teichoic acid export membrane protein